MFSVKLKRPVQIGAHFNVKSFFISSGQKSKWTNALLDFQIAATQLLHTVCWIAIFLRFELITNKSLWDLILNKDGLELGD